MEACAWHCSLPSFLVTGTLLHLALLFSWAPCPCLMTQFQLLPTRIFCPVAELATCNPHPLTTVCLHLCNPSPPSPPLTRTRTPMQSKFPLRFQRPFAYENVVLRDVTQPAPLNPEHPESINAFLEAKVGGQRL